MPKIKLTPEDKAKLIAAINNDTEPTSDLLPKLFPGTAEKFEKFDVQALDRAKIPTLEYAGKRSKAAILAEAGAGIGAAPLQTVRCFGEAKDDEWNNLIVQGDNLQFLKTCYNNTDLLIKDKVKGKIKLIYIDPPFATKSDFGGKEGEKSYSDKIDSAEFIEALRERLIYLRVLLADDGSIYLHCDYRLSGSIRLILDEVFGNRNFLNEIIWCYGERERKLEFYNPKHDTIFFYAKNRSNGSRTFNWEAAASEYSPVTRAKFKFDDNDGKGPYQIRGRNQQGSPIQAADGLNHEHEKKYPGLTYRDYLNDREGVAPRDWWQIPIINKASDERLYYSTQKPEKLIERIISVSSNPDYLILDCFAGSGTTASLAEKLGRRWIACDFGKHAIYTMQKRLLHISESKAVIEETNNTGKVVVKKGDPYQKAPKPFCVVSSGAYDFSHIMDLRKHKETYIDFVLGLFQLSRDEEKAVKYKLANIYAIRDGNPVEVYPVWDDQFLKEVKIDEEYLQGIITQSGGKLKGDYYIITPESCANVGDTTLKNQDGKDINFHIQTFPYKVLEEVSRKFELQEQPSSQADVNTLITSTAFYFNEEVQLKAERTNYGLKITRFETKILDKEGNRFAGFSGLAMLLVDLDYEAGKPFDMDRTVFAKDIAEDGAIKIEGMTQRVGLIAIDKHGNESKPFNLK